MAGAWPYICGQQQGGSARVLRVRLATVMHEPQPRAPLAAEHRLRLQEDMKCLP